MMNNSQAQNGSHLIEVKKSVKKKMNKFEWNMELDTFLMKNVIKNYFNFEVVSIEINNEARRRGFNFGIANAFTNEKCRLRWSYLHL